MSFGMTKKISREKAYTMDKESEATKKISDETICNYFYIMFVVVAVLAGIALLGDLYTIARVPRMGLWILLRSLPVLALAVLNALFTRALLK